jgi:hypothetical protein
MSENILYSLGVYLGEYVIDHKLPTLSCDDVTSRNVIQVTWGEAQELRRLNDIWYNKYEELKYKLYKEFPDEKRWKLDNQANDLNKDNWNAYREYDNILSKKYIPETLEINVPFIDFSDENANLIIKEGFRDALWGCDMCYYSLEFDDIIFKNDSDDTYNFASVILKYKNDE